MYETWKLFFYIFILLQLQMATIKIIERLTKIQFIFHS